MKREDLMESASIVIERFGKNYWLLKHPEYTCPFVISKQAAVHILENETDIYLVGGDSQ